MSKKKIVIVGGVAGGASAAARARRLSEDAEIILFERGPYISFANCGLPYHIGGEIKDRDRLLVQTPESMEGRFNIDVRINSEVIKIDIENKLIEINNKARNEVYSESYDALVLSPGASAIRPPIPGIDNERIFTLRNIPDMDQINGFIAEQEVRCAVVVGGGYIGLEMVEALRNRKIEVTVVELAEQVMGPVDPEMATLLHQELRMHGVDLRLGVSVVGFDAQDNGLSITLSNDDNVLSDMVILAIGVRPENSLAKAAGLKIGELGGIVVNQHMLTSDKNIYAVGDAIEVEEFVSGKSALIPLAGPANRQGRIAADNIFGRDSVYNATQGTGICKVFNQTVGMTGLNEKLLKRFEIAYEKIYVHPAQHAGYYPGSTPISFKLLFAPESGKILGAQAVGANGVDKRIDVLAMAIRAGQTVYDLEEAELSYAPPYGSAKDVVNYAGFVASNVLKGDMGICHVDEVLNIDGSKQILVDVRTSLEFEMGSIPGSINVPVDLLRLHLADLPRDRELLVYCRVGLR
ncbi:MAG: FAD-dependent oxidoreductase, partial [Gammaproteobacteria bacterium]|nr:FAD-dependent oxidoreductase [Gammaproteobacteria bacterium]